MRLPIGFYTSIFGKAPDDSSRLVSGIYGASCEVTRPFPGDPPRNQQETIKALQYQIRICQKINYGGIADTRVHRRELADAIGVVLFRGDRPDKAIKDLQQLCKEDQIDRYYSARTFDVWYWSTWAYRTAITICKEWEYEASISRHFKIVAPGVWKPRMIPGRCDRPGAGGVA